MTDNDTPKPSALTLAHAVACQPDRRLWPTVGCVARIGDHWCGRTRVAEGLLCTRCTVVARTRVTTTLRLPDRAAIRKYERRGRK